MQVFEFHFNPKLKPDLIFDSFCYEPENIYERKMGSLYLVGLLKNVLPRNLRFLEKLQKVIKEKYYKSTIFTPEKSLRESLKEANEFLEGLAKKGDVSWLGNLSFAILVLKNFKLNFTKVGGMKIFLLRRGQIIDIDKKLKFQDIEPYPLKIFGNIVSGKLSEGDLILVLTKEIFDFFQENLLLNEIAKLPRFSEKELKDILNRKKEELSKISGALLAISLRKEVLVGKREIILPKISKEFSLKEVLAPFLRPFKKFQKPKINIPNPKELIRNLISFVIRRKVLNKKLILILALILVLILGFIFSQLEERQKIRIYQKNLEEVNKKFNLAQGLLILDNPQAQKEANSLLKESLEKITPILKETQNLPKEFNVRILSQRDEILEKLYSLNKLEKIEEPELFFEFNREKFIPQKLVTLGDDLYFFSPYSKDLFKLNKNKNGELISVDKKFDLATMIADSILFFSKPNQLIVYRGLTPVNLKEPYPDFNFDALSSFKGNLYFLDKKAGQIIKYPSTGSGQVPFSWGTPEFWLKKAIVGKSIAVDGSVWVLEKDAISKYYAGNLQEKITPDIFPPPKDFSKIFTSPTLPYFYLLEPGQKRIVILTKAGEIIKQYQSQKFDNLLDFSVSEGTKIIYLLNGLKVYKINLNLNNR